MFGLALRAAAEDFDTARLMGVKSDMVIRGAFASVGCARRYRRRLLADARRADRHPVAGIDAMLKGVLAALIGGLGSLRGAVLGGFALGVAEVLLRSQLPGRSASLDRRRRLRIDRSALHLPAPGSGHGPTAERV